MQKLNWRRIVLKVGSALIAPDQDGCRSRYLLTIAQFIVRCRARGIEVILVSSGSVAAGSHLFPSDIPRSVVMKKAMAAAGQTEMMAMWDRFFDFPSAQLLLTHGDLRDRERYESIRETIFTLLEHGVLPIINENDAVTTDDLKVGDNDNLSAMVAAAADADALMIFSDVDGLYDKNPNLHDDAVLLPEIKSIDESIYAMAGCATSSVGTGGMKTKIEAAKICQLAGCYMVIANGNHKNPIKEMIENQKCTWFLPRVSKLDARKQWIIGSVAPKGEVIIDQGAVKAINDGKSLLPAGIKKINGIFEKGDHILVKDQNDFECARGLTSFSSIEIEKIKGSHSREIKNILGYSSREEIIHKDDLVKV